MEEWQVDEEMLEVLSFFEEMTFEKVILDWPSYADEVTREEIFASLDRLKKEKSVIERTSKDGPIYKKEFKKKKRWKIF